MKHIVSSILKFILFLIFIIVCSITIIPLIIIIVNEMECIEDGKDGFIIKIFNQL